MYARGRSRSREDDRYSLLRFLTVYDGLGESSVRQMGQFCWWPQLCVVCSDTGRGRGESPEDDPAPAPNQPPQEKPPTPPHPPITQRKKSGRHAPHRAPGPGPHQDLAPAHVLDPGLDARRGGARKAPPPPPQSVIMWGGPESVICREKICLFWHECNVPWTICRTLVFAALF